MLTVIHCGQLFTGSGADPVMEAAIVVEDDRIRSVSAAADVPGATVIDLSRYFVMPGLVDAHTHLSVRPARGDHDHAHHGRGGLAGRVHPRRAS